MRVWPASGGCEDRTVEDGAFDLLLRHFADPAVGMMGGHPAPDNGAGTFLGHAVHLQPCPRQDRKPTRQLGHDIA